MVNIKRLLLVGAATLWSLNLQTPVHAQEQVDELLPQAACFEKTAANGEVLSIIVPKVSSSAMRAKGFERRPCRKAFENIAERDSYRDGVCHLAATYSEQQKLVFENRYGERPEVLCGMAEVAISQWHFRGRN